jgi:hypothetical protein
MAKGVAEGRIGSSEPPQGPSRVANHPQGPKWGWPKPPQVVKVGGSLTQKWVAKSPNAQIYLFFCVFFLFDLGVFFEFVKIHEDNFENLRKKNTRAWHVTNF